MSHLRVNGVYYTELGRLIAMNDLLRKVKRVVEVRNQSIIIADHILKHKGRSVAVAVNPREAEEITCGVLSVMPEAKYIGKSPSQRPDFDLIIFKL